MTRITDTVTLGDSVRLTDSGYLESFARTARTGVQKYLGRELGRDELGIVNVYRDESEVFNKDSLQTFSKLPITDDHPATDVDASNWRDLAVGVTGDDVLRDGEYLKIGLKITDANAVKAVQDGKRELSVGYSAEIVWADGVAPDGTPYQAVQRNIKANHIAIVNSGRAGSQARIGDSWGAMPLNGADLIDFAHGTNKVNDFQPGVQPKTVKGGRMSDQTKPVVLGDSVAQVLLNDVATVEKFKSDMQQKLKDAQTALNDAIAAKDEEIGSLKAELASAKAAAIVDVDALVAARTELVAQVKTLDAAIEPKGKSDAELKRAAVASKLGDAAVTGVSDAEVNGMFKALTALKPTNPVATAIAHGVTSVTDAATAEKAAFQKSVNDMNAWRNA